MQQQKRPDNTVLQCELAWLGEKGAGEGIKSDAPYLEAARQGSNACCDFARLYLSNLLPDNCCALRVTVCACATGNGIQILLRPLDDITGEELVYIVKLQQLQQDIAVSELKEIAGTIAKYFLAVQEGQEKKVRQTANGTALILIK